MASKRKAAEPSKLCEEKRSCRSWNMNEHVKGSDDDLVKDSCHSSSNEKTNVPANDDESGDKRRFTKKKRKVPQKHSSVSPFLLIEIENMSFLKKQPQQSTLLDLGPKISQIILTKGSSAQNGGVQNVHCGDNGTATDLDENCIFFLKIYNNNTTETMVEAYDVDIVSIQRSHYESTNLNSVKQYMSIVYEGRLLLPTVMIESLNILVKNKRLKITFSPEMWTHDQIFLDVQLLEGGVSIFADEERYAVGSPSVVNSLKTIMSYYYGIKDEPTMALLTRKFNFTASEIPALYDHIKKYHFKRFNIANATDKLHSEQCHALRPTESEANLSSLFFNGKPRMFERIHSLNDLSSYEEEKNDHFGEFIESEDADIAEVIDGKGPAKLDANDVFLDNLIPSLRKYQQEALKWMISRENETEYELGEEKHILWHQLVLEQKAGSVYFNPKTGRICSKLIIQPLPKGGILADEMGLGKTVEVLALISRNKRKERFVLDESRQSCKSVSVSMCSEDTNNGVAASIKRSKEEDLLVEESKDYCCFCGKNVHSENERENCNDCGQSMHFGCAGTQGRKLKKYYCAVCATKELYLGVAKSGFIQPAILAEFDIIITTYSTLNSEFHHVKSEEGRERSLRNRKKYAALPSPLTFLEFWRVCMDEAQMIQCTTTRLAEMVLRISAVHRWCVTGTPVQRGLEDVYGMLLFIGFFPYCLKSWWNKLLREPLCHGYTKPLFDVLARVMWRTEKKDVLDQINLPKQTETFEMLTFTPVEWQFYKRQEELCTASALTEIEKWKEKETILSSLDKSSLHSLLAPLLRLRQACCHPRAVRDGLLGIQKSHLTMDKLLEGLTSKAKLECEEAHRQLMCALNGLAAIDMIESKATEEAQQNSATALIGLLIMEFANAVTKYREAIQSWAAHKDIFRTDLLQKLHTIKNLSETLHKLSQCSHALSDGTIDNEADELAKEYMKKPESQIASAQSRLAPVESNLNDEKSEVDWKDPWWIHIMSHFNSPEDENLFIVKIKDELRSQLSSPTFMQTRFKTIDGLRYLMVSKITKLDELRDELKISLNDLQKEPSKEMILTTAACCLRPVEGSNAERCPFCKADDIFTEYENNLFSHRGMKKNETVEGDDNKRFGGLRAETELDVVLKTIYSMARQKSVDLKFQSQTKAHLKYMDLLKQEFKCLRNLWFALHKRISACDELEMSIIRMRLRYEDETSNESYIIDKHEIGFQRFKLQADRTAALHMLGKKKGQLFYLKNLEKAQSSTHDSNPDACPICKDSLGKQLEQRPGILAVRRKGVRLDCPMCREPTLSEDISFVVMGNRKSEAENEIKVKGSYSVKIEAVIRKILEIGQNDPDGKIIVFSTWQDVLGIIAQALAENDIVFRYGLGSRQKFRGCLSDFKVLPYVKVLLLPLKRGSKGLNIIEATHVILTEPTLNPANELQAIGRVHRIGQTKPTFVHRFIVRDTIEERIREFLKTRSETEWISINDAASSSLTIGDLSSLLLEKQHDKKENISLFECGTASIPEPAASGLISPAISSKETPTTAPSVSSMQTAVGNQGNETTEARVSVSGEVPATVVTETMPPELGTLELGTASREISLDTTSHVPSVATPQESSLI
eukprot:gene14371-5419_t